MTPLPMLWSRVIALSPQIISAPDNLGVPPSKCARFQLFVLLDTLGSLLLERPKWLVFMFPARFSFKVCPLPLFPAFKAFFWFNCMESSPMEAANASDHVFSVWDGCIFFRPIHLLEQSSSDCAPVRPPHRSRHSCNPFPLDQNRLGVLQLVCGPTLLFLREST